MSQLAKLLYQVCRDEKVHKEASRDRQTNRQKDRLTSLNFLSRSATSLARCASFSFASLSSLCFSRLSLSYLSLSSLACEIKYILW